MNNRYIFLSLIFLIPLILPAQGDYYENVGKIYSVVGVVAVILVGLTFLLFYIDRRLRNIEKHMTHDNRNE